MSEVVTAREIKVLQFDQVRQQLAALTVCPVANKKALNLLPLSDYFVISRLQKETSEGRLLCAKNAFNPSRVEDIEPYLTRADKGALLSGGELATVLIFLKAARRWPAFFKDSEKREMYPLLDQRAGLINNCSGLFSSLVKSLDEDGAVLDGASPLLSSLRRQKQTLQNKIRDKIDDYLRNSNYRRYMQDNLVTIRSGRYVLPVKQEYRQNVQGVVHDQSASGATLFIEPLPVVQMQNELISLQRSEDQEIERILYKLSSDVAELCHELAENRTIYSELDLIVARGRLSLSVNGIEPEILEKQQGELYFEDALHPLLGEEKVPLTVKLDENVQTLILTGPNTGGKTVALKTIGLLATMVQSGLHIAAERATKLSVFKKIRSDIGDEQSIAQSLSTFSGHMKNIIETIEEADPDTLVLFDELGAGTDPSEGSALAMAILEELTRRGALTVATTHINELKLFAQMQAKMQNAAMEFDSDTLTPTYRLLQGVPGQSNAFYIAEKLGLPSGVLLKAKSFVHRSHEQVESVIASLVEDQQRFHRDSRKAAQDRSRAEIMMEELEKERDLLQARRSDILNEARDEAKQLLKRTKTATDRMLKELRNIKAESGDISLARAEEIRREINLVQKDTGADDKADDEFGLVSEDLRPGLEVFVRSLRQTGEVISFSKDEALVQVGQMKVHLPLSELRKAKSQKKKNADTLPDKGQSGYTVSKDSSITSSIDLRGMNFEEARPLVDKLFDNALWAGLNRVDLIHGKGTGKLKEGLRSYLIDHPLVDEFRSGGTGEGGEGVTVVQIKT